MACIPLTLGHGLRAHKSTKVARAGCYFSSDSIVTLWLTSKRLGVAGDKWGQTAASPRALGAPQGSPRPGALWALGDFCSPLPKETSSSLTSCFQGFCVNHVLSTFVHVFFLQSCANAILFYECGFCLACCP